MAIMKKPSAAARIDPADAFIEAAPDGRQPLRQAGGRIYKQRKTPVSFTAEKDLLEAFDAKAADLGISRAAALALVMSRFVKNEG